jgi:hypothetical protein
LAAPSSTGTVATATSGTAASDAESQQQLSQSPGRGAGAPAARPPYQFWRDPVAPLLLTLAGYLGFEGFRTMRHPWRAVSDSPYPWQVQLDNLTAAQRAAYRRLAPWHEHFGGDVGLQGRRGAGASGPGGLEWMRCLRWNVCRNIGVSAWPCGSSDPFSVFFSFLPFSVR